MNKNTASAASAEGIDKDFKTPALLDSGKKRMISIAFKSLPVSLLRIVGEYVSDSNIKDIETAFAGVQPITLCLSQDLKSEVDSSWPIGFLSPDLPWREKTNSIVDKQFLISDREGCLQFLSEKTPSYCPVFVEFLVVKLSMTTRDSPCVLEDLRRTIEMVQEFLVRVKHVVISITEYASFCFSLQASIGNATELLQTFDPRPLLHQIIDDLRACWTKNDRLDVCDLFDFYFNPNIKRPSERFLTKFVISLNHSLSRNCVKDETLRMVSAKIMWVCRLKTLEDYSCIDDTAIRLCHVIHLDTSSQTELSMQQHSHILKSISCYKDKPLLERIVINSSRRSGLMELFQPSSPPAHTSFLSALIEITLTGEKNMLHLTDLNNGCFPRLRHLTVFSGVFTGQLDSDRVPSLKTLILEPGEFINRARSKVSPLVRKHVRSLLRADRPWQLVACKSPGGWSLASYQDPIANPSDEEKKELPSSSSYSLPSIKELLLVACCKANIDEWQSSLQGTPRPEATAIDHKDRFLLWAPECVQKISMFSTTNDVLRSDFQKEIPGEARILSSLMSHGIGVMLNGSTMQQLQSLELKNAEVALLGAFPKLEKLSFDQCEMTRTWEIHAPSLQSLHSSNLKFGECLALNPQSLPQLSFLRILPCSLKADAFPNIVNIDDLGLSRVNHVVFGREMALSPSFNQLRVNNVSHLELFVNAFNLPYCWHNTPWRCETLILKVFAFSSAHTNSVPLPNILELPSLPLVKTLTVSSENSCLLLNKAMPNLTECTVPSPNTLGPNLRCPALRSIRFSGQMLLSDREKCLNSATYKAIDAHPKWVFIDESGFARSMTRNSDSDEKKSFPLVEFFKEGDGSPMFERVIFLLALVVLLLSFFRPLEATLAHGLFH